MPDIGILVADNDPDALANCAEFLESAGYRVYSAHNPAEARQIFTTSYLHLAILDLRLTDDDDEQDKTGLSLARELAATVPTLILTKFPTYQAVREALKLDARALPAAVDFINKRDGLDALLAAVEQALTTHVSINHALLMRWTDPPALPALFHLIEVQPEQTYSAELMAELEDLLRKLFFKRNEILIHRVLTRDPGRVILAVFAYSQDEPEGQFIVACGRRALVQNENALYERYALEDTGTGSTVMRRSVETLHFAATAYSCIGSDLEELQSLGNFYRNRSLAQVVVALDNLYQKTLDAWSRRGRFQEDGRISLKRSLEWLGLGPIDQAELGRRAEAICRESLATGLIRIDYSAHYLSFHLPAVESVTYPNPLTGLDLERLPVSTTVVWGTTHGRITPDTVLVDQQGQTWLVDFAQLASAPLLHDFVVLELAMILDLPDTLDLAARHTLSQQLLLANDHKDPHAERSLPPDLQQTLACVAHLRHLALGVMGADAKSYDSTLLLAALRRIAEYQPDQRYTRRTLMPYTHALLLAGMLYAQLVDLPQRRAQLPEQAMQRIWIDEVQREIWVEGRRIEVTPQEFRILLCLYQRHGKLYSRQELLRDAFDSENAQVQLEESRLNSALSRLRQKIEPNPDQPKYLITVRGHGYRLDIGS